MKNLIIKTIFLILPTIENYLPENKNLLKISNAKCYDKISEVSNMKFYLI